MRFQFLHSVLAATVTTVGCIAIQAAQDLEAGAPGDTWTTPVGVSRLPIIDEFSLTRSDLLLHRTTLAGHLHMA